MNEERLSDLEDRIRKELGWPSGSFYASRAVCLMRRLSASNAERFLNMPTWQKCQVIDRLIERGSII